MAELSHPADRRVVLRTALADLQAGRFAAAAAACRALGPEDVEGALLRGLAVAASGDPASAAPMLALVAAARPEHAHPLADLARLLASRGRASEAAAHFRAGLALAPAEPRLRLAFGEYLLAERPAEAADQAREALRLRPGLAAAHNLLGAALVASGTMADAIAAFGAAVGCAPDGASGWSNLGKALAAEGEFTAAIAALDRACALRPADAQLGLNRAVALLKAGRLAEGWEAFEIRREMPGHERVPPSLRLPAPLPPGGLAGRSILLIHEEGFGDTLQFIRYVPLLARQGARVLVQMPSELARLAARVAGVTAVLPLGPPPRCDFRAPFQSLPRSFGTTLGTIPAALPYVSPDPAEAAAWAARLSALPGRRIGLVWSGAPRPGNPAAVATDRLRSLPLAALAPLAALRGISFVSLQKGEAAAEAASPPGFALHDPMGSVTDFATTAAIIANLEAVVSVDTAVVHLAGAMGKPVFLLDRHDNCWRWLHGRSDSPWYPRLRRFAQPRPGAWPEVVAAVAAALGGTVN